MKKILGTPLFGSVAILVAASMACAPPPAEVEEPAEPVVVEEEGTCVGAGPQSPRDIRSAAGTNDVPFELAPAADEMHLCDIHFHRFAEHQAGGYSTLAGEGNHAGYVCEGHEPDHLGGGEAHEAGGAGGCGKVAKGDTVEVHWVFTTCDVEPGPELESCFDPPACAEPLLRVEGRVFYLTEEGEGGLDFADFSGPAAIVVPSGGGGVTYRGSTTGSAFSNEICSPAEVTWNVEPTCDPLDRASLDSWCGNNVFREVEAHEVRKLVTPLGLLSAIE